MRGEGAGEGVIGGRGEGGGPTSGSIRGLKGSLTVSFHWPELASTSAWRAGAECSVPPGAPPPTQPHLAHLAHLAHLFPLHRHRADLYLHRLAGSLARAQVRLEFQYKG